MRARALQVRRGKGPSPGALQASRIRRPSGCVAKGAALMVHYGYGPQQSGLDTYTEGLLARYKAIAQTRRGCVAPGGGGSSSKGGG